MIHTDTEVDSHNKEKTHHEDAKQLHKFLLITSPTTRQDESYRKQEKLNYLGIVPTTIDSYSPEHYFFYGGLLSHIRKRPLSMNNKLYA